jgi:hypothetical protein
VLPPGHPPTSAAPAATAPASAAELGPARAGGLGWTTSAPLVRRAPKSSMRAAEYGVEGDAQAELSVFYFGAGQGGDVEANITRWLGQITQADGSDTAKKAKRDQRTANGINVAIVEAQGAYSGGMAMPGMAAAGPIDDALLLGAIATGKEGPVFFKLVGPSAAVERARPAFDALIASLHAE